MNLRNLPLLALLSLVPITAGAETVRIEAGRDATLVEHPDGALANGSGPFFFVGRTGQGQNSLRRSLLWFDVAAALGPGGTRDSVPPGIAFRSHQRRRRPRNVDFVAQYLACTCPCQRFGVVLTADAT